MDDKLKKEISKEVDAIFAGKKEDEMRKRTESALEESATTIEALTTSLTTEKESTKELAEKLATAEAAIKVLEDDKVASAKEVEKAGKEQSEELDTLKKELEEKSTELDNIKKDAIAAKRMEELTTAGVARNDTEDQTAKVREMSDEAFASYSEELVSVRESVLAELKAAEDTKASKDGKDSKEEKAAKDGEEKTDNKETVNTPPANIDPGSSVSAALNMEIFPSDDIVAKYTELGNAMAEAITKDK